MAVVPPARGRIVGSLDTYDILFVLFAFLFQIVLIIHFALRRWRFELAMRTGTIVYALGLPALILSVVLFQHGKPWSLWVGGLLYAAWGLFGYIVEYVRRIDWRSPGHRLLFIIYLTLYLSTVMFYWWPLATLYPPLWLAYAILFVVATILNVISHHPEVRPRAAG